MAARPGEDVAATLFADVHYYYGPPTAKPPHHRFDKGSYIYLIENASQRKARVEIANNAGTEDQDAVSGYLDGSHVKYSYLQSTLVTLTVENPHGYRAAPLEIPEWHLPTFDPRNENKYMYKLNTLDIYFYVKEDALQFLGGVRRVLPQQQITILDEPVLPPPHNDPMSPVVQKLENVAVTDPSYQHGQTRDSRTSTTSFPGPSGPAVSAIPQSQEAPNFAPLAYNPAAPAAPETIAHREKTPPPEDGASNPLMTAAAVDHGQTYGGGYHNPGLSGPPSQPQSQTSYFPTAGITPGPPSQPLPSAATPQSPFAQHFQHSFAPPPTAATLSNPYARSPDTEAYPAALPPPPAYQPQQTPTAQQFASYPASASSIASPGIYSPGLASSQANVNVSSPGNQASGQPAQHTPPASVAPPGGFAQFDYTPQKVQTPYGVHSQISATPPLMSDHNIHQQVYRPTETEAAVRYGERVKIGRAHTDKPLKPATGKLEARAEKLEKGVGGFLKKLEKKYG